MINADNQGIWACVFGQRRGSLGSSRDSVALASDDLPPPVKEKENGVRLAPHNPFMRTQGGALATSSHNSDDAPRIKRP